MVEGARLESVYTATYRGFESLLLRQNLKALIKKIRAFFMERLLIGDLLDFLEVPKR